MPTVPAKIGVLTISDRASAGVYEDISGPAIAEWLRKALNVPYELDARVIPDGLESVRDALIDMADNADCCLVLTTGGTGPAPRDLTPEATLAAAHREMPGFGELMRAKSLEQTPTAILSRQTAAHRGACLIVELARQPALDRPVPEGGVSGNSLLHRSDWRRMARYGPGFRQNRAPSKKIGLLPRKISLRAGFLPPTGNCVMWLLYCMTDANLASE